MIDSLIPTDMCVCVVLYMILNNLYFQKDLCIDHQPGFCYMKMEENRKSM